MVKKKGQKSSQSKKKMDLAAAVEAAEQGIGDDVSKLNLDDSEPASITEDQTENNDGVGTRNNEDEGATLMNFNPPEENPATEKTGEIQIDIDMDFIHFTCKLMCFLR